MKILVIRFSSDAEIILTTPVVRNLKTQVDGAEVHYCTERSMYPLLHANPYIDKIHLLGDSTRTLIRLLQKEEFDYVVDLQNDFRSRIIKLSLRKPSAKFRSLYWKKWLMVRLKINKLPNLHIVDRFMETVRDLNVKMDSLGLDFFIPENESVSKASLPSPFRKEYVVFAMGAGYGTRRLPPGRMIELCDKINKPVILIGDKEDHDDGERIRLFFEKNENSAPFEEGLKELNKKTVVYNGCGQYSVNQAASLIKEARYVFSHESKWMHIAAAFKKPVFSIWGNTIPRFGTYPYRTQFTIFENNRIDCRPCSATGHAKCPKGHFNCMNKLIFDFYLP